MYRYGDGSPFPLDENFIETLGSLVSACASGHRALIKSREAHAAHERVIADVANESAELAELEGATLATVRGFAESGSATAVASVVQKLVAATKTAVASGSEQLRAKERQLREQAPPDPQQVVATALTPFFERHQVPFAQWTIAWDARTAPPSAHALALATECAATFELPLTGYWKDVPMVPAVQQGLSAKLPAEKGTHPLEKTCVVAFERSGPDQYTMYLRDHPTRPTCGWKLTWKTDAATGPMTGPMTGLLTDATSEPRGAGFELSETDAAAVRKLGASLIGTLSARLADRRLRELRFIGADAPGWTLQNGIDGLLSACAPLINNMAARSGSADEFVLKRDLASGRREEFFVTRAELGILFEDLPSDAQRTFQNAGLGL